MTVDMKVSREDESKRNVENFEFEETDTRCRSSSIFYEFLSKAMCSTVERLKTLNIESDDVTNFLNTHQLLDRCDPVLIVISYPFDVDFSSTSFSSLFSSSSLSCPQSSSSLLSRAFCCKICCCHASNTASVSATVMSGNSRAS